MFHTLMDEPFKSVSTTEITYVRVIMEDDAG